MGHFKKKSANTNQEVPTSALPDVIFILLIFFMVTTVLREVKLQVRVEYAEAENIEKISQKRLLTYIYIGPEIISGSQTGETRIQVDDALIEDVGAIRNLMYDKLQEQPKLIVSMRIDDDTETGIVTDVQQELREAGTLRINYSTKQEMTNMN